MTDEVNNPAHYNIFPDKQAIDIIRDGLTLHEYIGYLKGNILKYRLRAGKKASASKDLAKAEWYENKLKSTYEGFSVDVKI